MVKLLHTADLHLDSPLRSLALRNPDLRDKVSVATRTALKKIVSLAIDNNVAALLISGDLYDGAVRSAKTAAFLTAQFDRLNQHEIKIFYIKGNHDAESPLTGEVTLPQNVHVFDGRGGKVELGSTDIWIHGVSFAGRHAPESLLHKFHAPVDGMVNIGMLHTSLAGASGHDDYAPCSVGELAAMGFDYWALGHVHKRQVHSKEPWIVMPGMPQGRDIGEVGTKSATLLTVDNGQIKVEELVTSQVEFNKVEIDVSKIETEDELRKLLRDTLIAHKDVLDSHYAILRVHLTGTSDLGWRILRDQDIWTETTAEIATETECLLIDKVTFDFNISSHKVDTADATTELHKLMEEILAESGFASRSQQEVETVLNQLPQERRAELLAGPEAAECLADRIAQSGKDRIIALMKGDST